MNFHSSMCMFIQIPQKKLNVDLQKKNETILQQSVGITLLLPVLDGSW